jgi:hypothetical protein
LLLQKRNSMMTLIGILIIGALSFLCTEWLPLPWYTPMIIAFIFGLVSAKMKVFPFVTGALGVGLFWVIKLISPYLAQDSALVQKMAQLFTDTLGFSITPFLLAVFTFIIGALLGGLATLSGNLFLANAAVRPNLLRRGRNRRRGKTFKLKLQ